MHKLFTKSALFILALLFYSENGFSQSSMTFFKDTIRRMGSSMTGSSYDNGKYIYLWGEGIGSLSLQVPQVQKIDSSGNLIWSTASSKLFTEGYVSTAYIDSNYFYAIGVIPVLSSTSRFFFSKIDKLSGAVLLKIENPNLNGYGIIDIRDKGADSIRVVCFSYDDAQANPNWPPIVSLTINKLNGNASLPVPFGRSDLAPLFIDSNDNAYYYTDTDSLIKYDITQGAVVWKNKTLLAGSFEYRPTTYLKKENNKIYTFGDRYCRQIDDNTGITLWNIRITSNSNQEFFPSDVVFKNDTIYTSWLHPYSGSINEYGHFSKIDKNNGTIYLNGTITDNGGINFSGTGFFRGYKVVVDNSNDIFLFGNYLNDLTGQRVIKKITPNGTLISERRLSVDTIVLQQNNIIQKKIYGYATGFVFNNKPCFLYSKYIFASPSLEPSVRICFTSLSSDLSLKSEKFYENNEYQYPSTVIDIQRYQSYIYVLKKQGLGIYLEKFLSPSNLVWRKDLSSNCFFTPSAFAIDSTGIVCVIGYSLGCEIYPNAITLTSKFPISKIIYVDPNGIIINDFNINSIGNNTLLPNLLGTENGFHLTLPTGVYKLDPSSSSLQANTSISSNFSNGFWNSLSNKIFLTLNDTDSIYVFSSRLTNFTDAFYHAVNKQTLVATKKLLTSSFPQGYLLNAVKSVKTANFAYVSGLTGQGGFPTIIKLNYKTNTVIWTYSLNKIGEAFKIVEDDAGFVYALIRISDSTKIIKINDLNGTLIWQYNKHEPNNNARSIDLDINNATKTVVAAGLNTVSNNYLSYCISLNSQTGTLNYLQVLQGDVTEPNFIQALTATKDSLTMIGGNLNSVLLDGLNGFLLFKGTPASTPPCTTNYWLGTINNNWETAGNWSCGIIPGPDSNVIINGGTPVLNSNVTISTLTINTGVIFTVNPGFNLIVLH